MNKADLRTAMEAIRDGDSKFKWDELAALSKTLEPYAAGQFDTTLSFWNGILDTDSKESMSNFMDEVLENLRLQ